MKAINNFIVEHLEYSTFPINEKLKISSKSNVYTCQPKDKFELRKILKKRLAKDKNADLNDIDVSQITDMGNRGVPFGTGLFQHLDPHNIDISQWDVSKVKDMSYMFYACNNFNSDLSRWNVSNVTDMTSVFYHCETFNCDLSDWNISNVTDMPTMFSGCDNFNYDLSNWDVSNVTNMRWMFFRCISLKNKPSWYKE